MLIDFFNGLVVLLYVVFVICCSEVFVYVVVVFLEVCLDEEVWNVIDVF